MAKKAERTYSGYRPYEVVSALTKAIRRGDTESALFWAVELDLSGETFWLWRRLLIAVSEDIGPAWPDGPANIRALYENWRMVGSEDCWVHAVFLLCRAPKSRVVDDALAAHLMGHMQEFRRLIPDEAKDLHTVAGQILGRREETVVGQEHWFTEASKLVNEVDDPEAVYYRELTRKFWTEGRQYPEPRKPEEFQKPPAKDYTLPLGTEQDGDVVKVPGTQPGNVWEVDTKHLTCSCPAFRRWPPCKHVNAVKAMLKNGTGPR